MSHKPKATATSGRRSGAGASLRPRRSGLRVSALIGLVLVAGALVLAGGTTGHEGHEHRAPGEAIDPEHAYPYGLIAAGGGHFHALLVTPDLRTLFAGTHIGLFRSQDRGVTWRLVASRFSGDDVHAVAVDGKTGVLYAATHGQGLLASPDQGAHWYDESDALPGRDLHALALEPMTGGVYVWAVGTLTWARMASIATGRAHRSGLLGRGPAGRPGLRHRREATHQLCTARQEPRLGRGVTVSESGQTGAETHRRREQGRPLPGG
jgi:hypothetical protein